MKPAPSNSNSTGDQQGNAGGGADISVVHADIIGAHILTRLDGLSLSSSICASSHLRSVAADDEERLWRNVSTSTWPSISDPRVQRFISSFPSFHRGFFSECFPLLTGHVSDLRKRATPNSSIVTEELISAVDIYYGNEPVFSRVQETETVSGWFEHSPLRIDLLGPKESFRVGIGPVRNDSEDLESELGENLKLSWVLIDPARKTSANLSSLGAVATERHWLTGEITVKYSTVIRVDRGQRAVEVEVKVTCLGEMHVREVGMRVEDVEGKWLNGKDSLGILVNAMEFGGRKIDKEGVKGRERYERYLEMKRVWSEDKERRERKMGMACISVGVLVFVGFCVLLSFLL